MAGFMGGGGGTSLQTSTSSTATGKQSGMFDDSGMVVNYGSGSAAGAATSSVPGWFYPAIAIAAVLWLTRKR